ncbi:UNVERIFIED_ORG: hypothetical protein J2W65_001497 [Pseudomonas parafulva]|nr:hypothetical protein [Pseudomonas parafulva]TCT98746.1 hypothetical protein EC913_104215 [Pseudomonas sp. LP_4_YM]
MSSTKTSAMRLAWNSYLKILETSGGRIIQGEKVCFNGHKT